MLRKNTLSRKDRYTAGDGLWRLGCVVALLIVGWYTIDYLLLDAKWGLIDGANFVIHESGHSLFGWLGQTLGMLGGTLAQTLVPLGCALYFWTRHQRFAASVCGWWLGQSLLNVSVYIDDAVVMALPLFGGGVHDWNYLLGTWQLLHRANELASAVRIIGSLLMLAGLGYAVYCIRKGPKYGSVNG